MWRVTKCTACEYLSLDLPPVGTEGLHPSRALRAHVARRVSAYVKGSPPGDTEGV